MNMERPRLPSSGMPKRAKLPVFVDPTPSVASYPSPIPSTPSRIPSLSQHSTTSLKKDRDGFLIPLLPDTANRGLGPRPLYLSGTDPNAVLKTPGRDSLNGKTVGAAGSRKLVPRVRPQSMSAKENAVRLEWDEVGRERGGDVGIGETAVSVQQRFRSSSVKLRPVTRHRQAQDVSDFRRSEASDASLIGVPSTPRSALTPRSSSSALADMPVYKDFGDIDDASAFTPHRSLLHSPPNKFTAASVPCPSLGPQSQVLKSAEATPISAPMPSEYADPGKEAVARESMTANDARLSPRIPFVARKSLSRTPPRLVGESTSIPTDRLSDSVSPYIPRGDQISEFGVCFSPPIPALRSRKHGDRRAEMADVSILPDGAPAEGAMNAHSFAAAQEDRLQAPLDLDAGAVGHGLPCVAQEQVELRGHPADEQVDINAGVTMMSASDPDNRNGDDPDATSLHRCAMPFEVPGERELRSTTSKQARDECEPSMSPDIAAAMLGAAEVMEQVRLQADDAIARSSVIETEGSAFESVLSKLRLEIHQLGGRLQAMETRGGENAGLIAGQAQRITNLEADVRTLSDQVLVQSLKSGASLSSDASSNIDLVDGKSRQHGGIKAVVQYLVVSVVALILAIEMARWYA